MSKLNYCRGQGRFGVGSELRSQVFRTALRECPQHFVQNTEYRNAIVRRNRLLARRAAAGGIHVRPDCSGFKPDQTWFDALA